MTAKPPVAKPARHNDPIAHPLADVFPFMSDDEAIDLRRSILKVGLLEPIVLFEGKVLDGRNRLKACRAVDVEPTFVEFSGLDPFEFVYGKNIPRRHLTPSQRGLAAANLLALQPGKHSHKDVREKFGCGETVVTQAVRVKKDGVKGLEKMIENGEIEVKTAAVVATLPKAEQAKVVAAGAKSVKAKCSQIKKEQRTNKPAAVKSPAAQAADPEFSGLLGECVRDLTNLSAKITKLIQTSDGERFAEYVKTLGLGWIDHSGVKLADAGEGLKKHGPQFVALRPARRLLAASFRHRVYPAAQLRAMLDMPEGGVLDADRPPADETVLAPAEELVEPESL